MSSDFRYEIKFQLSERNYSFLQSWLYGNESFWRAHPNRTVNSLYFDDLKHSSVKDNLSGVANRSKYRLRWYGGLLHDVNNIIFEEKIRNGRVGRKKQLTTSANFPDISSAELHKISNAVNRLYPDTTPYISFDYLLPTLILSYEREYFSDNNGLRITIDSKLRFAKPDLLKPLAQHRSVEIGGKILEFKFDLERKELARSYISKLDLTPVRNSKYLIGMALFKDASYI